jgi:hypothetical protein
MSFNYSLTINNNKIDYVSNLTLELYPNDNIIFTPKPLVKNISNEYYITSDFPLCANGLSNGIIAGTILSSYKNNSYDIEVSYFVSNNKYIWKITINVLEPIPIIPTNNIITNIEYEQDNNIKFINLYVNESFIITPTKIDNYIKSLTTVSNTNSIIYINNDGVISGYFTVPGAYIIHLDYYTTTEKSTIIFQFIIFPKIFKVYGNDFVCSVTVNSNLAIDYQSSIINLHSLDKIIIHPKLTIPNSNPYFDILSVLDYITNTEYIIPNTNNNITQQLKILYCDINGQTHIWDSLFNIIPYKTFSQTEYVCYININDTIFNIYTSGTILNVKTNDKIVFFPIPIIPNLDNKYYIISNIPTNNINYKNNTIICPKNNIITCKYKIEIIYYKNTIKYSWIAILNII